MSEIPQPPSSNESKSPVDKERLGSEQEEFVPSVLDGPDVDVNKYLEAQQRAARRTRRFLQFALGIAVIAVPVTYLKINGTLSSNGVRRALNQKVEEPAGKNGNSTYGLGGGGTAKSGAGIKVKKSNAITQDLKNYVFKDLKSINPDELKALTAFDSVTGSNFKNEATTYAVVQDTVIPAYARFLKKAEAIQPKTPEVRAVHQIFVQSARVKALAFRHLMDGRGDKSGAWQYGVKAEFETSSQLSNEFKAQANLLAQSQGIKLP